MTTGHEEEFRRLFEEEARTRLEALAEQALELESGAGGPELVDSMFRHAHTLKGGAGVVGLPEIADVVHDLEQMIEDLRAGRRDPSRAVADAVLGAVDALRDMVAHALAQEDQAPAAAAARAALARADEGPAKVAAPAPQVEAPRAAPAPPEDRGSIPVPVRRLDELVRLVGESAAAQLRVGRLLSERLGDVPHSVDEYRDLARVLQDLQQQAMRARMVTFGTIAQPLRRAVRDIARATGKDVRWELTGEETELDRHVLEQLRDPLVALVRNAVDHGIETPGERVEAGKEPAGTVRVHAMQIGSDVVISVADDGRGVDVARVRAAAPGRGFSDEQALAAIFEPGLSTADAVTGVSGRGVGLDAVREAVDALRGRVEVHSSVGLGSEFRISVPVTLAVLRCLLVEAAGRPYAVPLHAAVALLAAGAAGDVTAEGRPAVWVGAGSIAVSDLADVLGVPGSGTEGPVAVLTSASGRHAFRVERLLGQREVVVKELGRLLPRLDLLSGASVEPDGSVMLVLDPTGLIDAAHGRRPELVEVRGEAPPALERAPSRGRILVVDDALTIRELQRSILERAGFDVVTAAGGAQALERLGAGDVDLVLTDIEMPDMDGLELTRAIRGSSSLGGLPVLILTSRTGDDDRRRGLEAGADGYLVKSAFDEHALLTAVSGLLGSPERAGDGS